VYLLRRSLGEDGSPWDNEEPSQSGDRKNGTYIFKNIKPYQNHFTKQANRLPVNSNVMPTE